MAITQLPPHIRQLVDKNNFVIAIKTLSQEQHISLEQAKALIDDYEASKVSPVVTSDTTAPTANAFDNLTQDLNNHLKQENIKPPLIPYWVKRVAVIILVMMILGWMIWRLFNGH